MRVMDPALLCGGLMNQGERSTVEELSQFQKSALPFATHPALQRNLKSSIRCSALCWDRARCKVPLTQPDKPPDCLPLELPTPIALLLDSVR